MFLMYRTLLIQNRIVRYVSKNYRHYRYFCITIRSPPNMIHTTFALCFVLLKGITFGTINTKDLAYYVYQDLHLNGCHLLNLNTAQRSTLTCAIFCSANLNCGAFKFMDVSSDCMTCRRNEVTGLSFMAGEITSLPRVMRQLDWPLTSYQRTIRSVAVPGGLKEGMVVHFTGLLIGSDFSINFAQAENTGDINLHFKGDTFESTPNPTLVFAHLKGGTWGTEVHPVMSPYPFKANATTAVHILVRKDMFIVYIDNKLCCNYTHVPGMLYTDVNYIRINGAILVYEISS